MSSFGERHTAAISFCVITPDRAILPCFDVARANLDEIDASFHCDWLDFCAKQRWQGGLEATLCTLRHTIERHDSMILVLPPHFIGGFLKNEPDLYECDGTRVLEFLRRSEMCLNDVRLRCAPQQRLVFSKVHPYTFLNLTVTNSAAFARVVAQNASTNQTVWCAIVAWWNYRSDDHGIQNGHGDGGEDTGDLVALIETYCKPLLLSRCDFFLMVWSAAVRLGDVNLRAFCAHHLPDVSIDDELILDTPQYCLHILSEQQLAPALDALIRHAINR